MPSTLCRLSQRKMLHVFLFSYIESICGRGACKLKRKCEKRGQGTGIRMT